MERPIDALLAEIPAPVQAMVCGTQFPRGDPVAMYRAAAVWRTRGGAYQELRLRAEISLDDLRAATCATHAIGSAAADAGARFVEQLNDASQFCEEKAAQLERNALVVERAQWEMGFLLLAVLAQLLCAGGWSGIGGFTVLSRARQSFLRLLEALVVTAGAKTTTAAGMRGAQLAVQVLGLGALQVGIDLGAQLVSRDHRPSLDSESLITAVVAGIGAGIGGAVGRSVAGALVSDTTLAGRVAVTAVAGASGIVGAVSLAALGNREIGSSGAEIIGGAALGVLAGRRGLARPGSAAADGPIPPIAMSSERPRHLPNESVLGTAARLAPIAERDAMGLLLRLDQVQFVTSGGVRGHGGDGGSAIRPPGHESGGPNGTQQPGGPGSTHPSGPAGGSSGRSATTSGAGPLSTRTPMGGPHGSGVEFVSARPYLLGAAAKPGGGVDTLPSARTSASESAVPEWTGRPNPMPPPENPRPAQTEVRVEKLLQLEVAEPDHPAPARSPQHVAGAAQADHMTGSASTVWTGSARYLAPLAVPGLGDVAYTPEHSSTLKDPTLTHPHLDPDDRHLGVIARPGQVIDPTEVDQLRRQSPTFGEIPAAPGHQAATQPMTASDGPAADEHSASSADAESMASTPEGPVDSHSTEDDQVARYAADARPVSPEEDRFRQWYSARAAAQEDGVPTQSVHQYARMHHLDEQQIRRWSASANIPAAALFTEPETPTPHPLGGSLHEWLRDLRRYLVATPDQMAELAGVGVGEWPALESTPSHQVSDSRHAVLCSVVRALLRRVPDARLRYPAIMQRFELDRGRQSGMGEFLRFLRESRGWSIEHLAAALDERAAVVWDREGARRLRRGWERHFSILAFGDSSIDLDRATVGESLGQLTERLGLSPEYVVDRMAVRAEVVRDIETGSLAPSLAMVELYALPLAPDGHIGQLLRDARIQRDLPIRRILAAADFSSTRFGNHERTGVLSSVRAWEAHLAAVIVLPHNIAERGYHLGSYLRYLREQSHLTIEQLAERMSPTAGAIRGLEAGSRATELLAEAYLAALAPRIPRFPEGHPTTGSYIRSLREDAEWSTSDLADAAGVKKPVLDALLGGRVIEPGKDLVAACFHALPHEPVTWLEVGEAFSYLPKEVLEFPDPYATESLYEYARYFQRRNRIGKTEMDELLGVQVNDYNEPSAAFVETALTVYHTILYRSGRPWNDFAEAWGYDYWMDPAGETMPDPTRYGSVHAWIRALRAFRREIRREFSEVVGRSLSWVVVVEAGTGKPSPSALQALFESCSIPNEMRRAVLDRFYPRPADAERHSEERRPETIDNVVDRQDTADPGVHTEQERQAGAKSMESALLQLLRDRVGQPVSRAEIFAYLWGTTDPDESDQRALKAMVHRLRRKLTATDSGAVTNVPGLGYRFDPGDSGGIGAASVTLDARTRHVFVDGVEVGVSFTQFRFLELLMGHPGVAVSSRRIWEHVWGSGAPNPRRINSQVVLLRQKLGSGAARVVTVPGFGYRFDPDGADGAGQHRPDTTATIESAGHQDPAAWRVFVGDREVALAPQQKALLRLLMDRAPAPLSAPQILDAMGVLGIVSVSIVRHHVDWLRIGLRGAGLVNPIEYLNGKGYRWNG
ncbi:winged helix-turn-helix domain-containing protein [Nocardia brasiliensis]|uniref:winged helix-turn-helix domain-containing protein n=1 Tax=Nocardia brasiliensis TaxID=37326 RepID=UPI002453E732|nr:winged helix-turn-helix domain-containing protein [Nocardia brasiliensis]